MSMLVLAFAVFTPLIGLCTGYVGISLAVVYAIGFVVLIQGLMRIRPDDVGIGFGVILAVAVVVLLDFLLAHFTIILK